MKMNEESVYRAAFWIQIGCQMLMAYYYSRNIRRSGRKSALTGESVEREGMGRFIDRSLILLYFPVVLMLSGCTSSTVPPNVILIMADDLGYETLRINGGLSYETPRLDALAAEGMRFTQAYSMPLCTPSRGQIMTGRYNFRNYIGFGLLDPAEKTFAHYLRDAGYATAVFGKWQLFGNSTQREMFGRSGTLPEDAGFDEHCLWQVREVGGSRYKDPYLYISGREPRTYPGEYGPDMVVDCLKGFIDRHRNESFFVYYPMILPHAPFRPSPAHRDYEAFDPDEAGSDTAYFADNVAYVDLLVGRITDTLESLELRERTLLIFIGDNGTARRVISRTSSGPVAGRKGFPTAAGTHVPMIVSWPGTLRPGQTNENLIDFTDFLPTLLDAARITETGASDGLSFYPQLFGSADSVRSWIFGDYAPQWGRFENSRYAHNRDWKLYESGSFHHFSEDRLEETPLPDSMLSEDALEIKRMFQTVLDRMK